ncbi:Serine/threonine-protein kinase StkP [bacterium HR17]|uniref:Serine/threonine-protein kinase StkP n=1 Tax=Candidatus Fervidibacter japonicus TaxID=2035412 RepID=A0A2H5XCK2_9BACT|nr:Serine/threonine-protein kinase StkP [bacterium HR17]
MQMCPECSADNKDTARFCIRCGAPLRRLRGRGTVLQGRYRLERVLGCGGMGAVYLATDLRLGNKVALKENLDMSPESQNQFAMEARILAHLRHPHLPRVQDFFVADGRQYLVMDYIAGDSLEDLVRKRGPLPPAEAVKWLLQVLDAVQYLHAQNPPIIHRDIKPANIKLGTDGKAYLVDFGIAKVLQAGNRTQAGARAVTPGYSPPEQYGTAPTDQRSDIYALGATLYFAVTGRVPPEAIERVTGHTDKLIPPRSINPTIPPALEQAILRAMRVTPAERFASVGEMRRALNTALTAPSALPQPKSRHRPQRAPSNPANLPATGVSVVAAPIWLRAVAFFLDLLIWGGVSWLVTLGYATALTYWSQQPFWWVWDEMMQRHVLSAMFLGGFFIYRSLMHAAAGRTVGKALCGLRVVNRQGLPCGWWRAIVREIMFSLVWCACGLGIVWALFDPYKQGWHDLAAGTFVVRHQ